MAGKPSGVIITRPAQDAAHWVKNLTNNGFNAQALPLIEMGPASGKADILILQDILHRLADYAAAMFVSGNAVQYFFQEKKAADQLKRAQSAIKTVAGSQLQPVRNPCTTVGYRSRRRSSRFSRVFSSRRDSLMKLSSIKGNCACAVLRATRGGFGSP